MLKKKITLEIMLNMFWILMQQRHKNSYQNLHASKFLLTISIHIKIHIRIYMIYSLHISWWVAHYKDSLYVWHVPKRVFLMQTLPYHFILWLAFTIAKFQSLSNVSLVVFTVYENIRQLFPKIMSLIEYFCKSSNRYDYKINGLLNLSYQLHYLAFIPILISG